MNLKQGNYRYYLAVYQVVEYGNAELGQIRLFSGPHRLYLLKDEIFQGVKWP